MDLISDRERDVLQQVASGYSTEEVADALTLSPHTIRSYVKSALRKLDAHSRAHAVALAMANGLIEGPPVDTRRP